jgi:HSP20 family protein
LPVERSFDRLFDEFFNEFRNFGLRPFNGFEQPFGTFSPSIDVSETDSEIKVVAEAPGLDEKDIEVSLANNVLTISGEKKVENEHKDENYHHVERSYGAFKRSFRLPVEVEADQVDATYKNGVLTITLPKSAAAQAKKIEVKAS